MYTQLESLENNRIYDKYKEQRILFSSSVTKSLGLKQQDVIVKIGMEATKGALVSSTMDDMVLLVKMNEYMQKKIYSAKGMVTVNLKFYDSLFKKEMSFNLYTKLLNMNNEGLNYQDMFYMSLQLRRRIPNELIKVYGKHHERLKKAAALLNKNAEGMIFSRGIKKVCFPFLITKESISLNYMGNPQAFLNQKAMIVIKSVDTDEVFEIIGRIDEEYGQSNDSYQIKLKYSIKQQSPRFAQSLESLNNMINK